MSGLSDFPGEFQYNQSRQDLDSGLYEKLEAIYNEANSIDPDVDHIRELATDGLGIEPDEENSENKPEEDD